MSILIDNNTRVICQGFTGKQGRVMTEGPADLRSMASARTLMSGLVRRAMDGFNTTRKQFFVDMNKGIL